MHGRPRATTLVAEEERANKTSCMADSTLPLEEPCVKPSWRGPNW